ncbi:PhzF family phenazine biosynthesis protein [Actomonas aquatica]|uniref:PhzF family phenazine biosynthesis protein n=1 Tax=Actomonas aquatica TaxID=2866162 RepID=A0ABZ1C5Z1_9BACT|nr:PhzF family phenazine biosynthesis protein [Opitutus sp. WL0086]WRQ87019.1 PhzF family phenazine biosynthesis protein [Opitutus sp. WL0086]
MLELPFYWVDAFTSHPFGGNPAAIVPLPHWLPDDQLQRMAWQHGLSETAFCVRTAADHYDLRWFTPATEVDLCGHATLATAHVLTHELATVGPQITFRTASGALTVTRQTHGRLELDFPARPSVALDPTTPAATALLAALGLPSAEWIGAARDHVVVLPDQAAVAAVQPDFVRLAACDTFAVIVTAPGDDCDFVSRFFAPRAGINEDPVTGSAHCTLVPYWAAKLGQNSLHARQTSARGGELWCHLRDDRVGLAGQAVTYLRGNITLP